MRHRVFLIALLVTVSGFDAAKAGDKIRRFLAPSPQVAQTQYAVPQQVMVDRNSVAPSPMLGSFVPNSTAWVRGNGVMGGGYTPLGQDERTSLTMYGPLAASRAQMRDVRVLQPTGYGTLRPVSAGDAAAYPNFPWSDSVPGLSGQNRLVRPRSPMIFPGWQTDSDTIDQQ